MKMFALLALLAVFQSAHGFAFEQKIAPGAAYRLSFEADGQTGESRWMIHLRDAEGNLSFDGTLENEWQKLSPEKKTYTQLFYAPPDAITFQLLTREPGVTLRNVKLEKLDPENPLLNGDFSEGNFSGWSETYNAHFTENEGKPALRVEQNGYALTDYTPVVGGGRYLLKSSQGSAGARVLAYDSLRHFIGMVERKRNGAIEMPENAAWLRVLYETGHSHLPTWRVNEILGVELKPEEVSEASPSKIEKCTEWEIVLAPGSDPREEHAARELRHWMTAITGKAPALLAEASKAKTRKIFVGRAWADAFAKDLKALEGSDGYAVRTKEGNIYVFGAHPRGALYGVHALLERNTDMIWPRPNPEFAAIFSKTPAITFSEADFLSRPTFIHRYVSRGGYGGSYIFQDWQERNGLNTPWTLHKGNNYLVWLRGAQLGYGGSYMTRLGGIKEKDEKVLPLIDGQRVDNRWRQPCYSYRGTVDGIVSSFREQLETLPGREMEYMSATIADNWTVCGCPDCMAPISLPNGEKLTAKSSDATKEPLFFSTRNFLMLNQVAEELAKDYPDLKIRTHAYIFTAEPPGVPVNPAIIPEFAAYPTKNERFPILSGKGSKIGGYDKGIWKRRFEQWGKDKKGELGFFGYYYAEGFNALADTAAEDYRALASFDAVQAHTEGFPVDEEELSAWDADGIEKWVIAKLMWDPSQDPETLRKEYIRRVYRGAEKEMTEFYKLIRDTWHNAPEDVFVNCHTSSNDIFQKLIVAPGIEEQARTLLAKAENATDHPQAKRIIQRQRAYFEKLGDKLGRISVPYVEESKNEWQEASSPHWEKASVIRNFRKVDDWRSFARGEEAEHQTTVRVMHDNENLYVRFDGVDENLAGQIKPSTPAGQAFPNGDRFEVRLRNAKSRDYYFAVGPGGHYYSHPSLGDRWKTAVTSDGDSWTALLAIPLNALGNDAQEYSAIKARLGRVYRLQGDEREESSHNGAGIFNEHSSFWLDFQIK